MGGKVALAGIGWRLPMPCLLATLGAARAVVIPRVALALSIEVNYSIRLCSDIFCIESSG